MTLHQDNEKYCIRCKQFWPLGNFHENPKSKDGLNSYCRKCVSEWKKENKEIVDKWKRENKDKITAYYRKWASSNQDTIDNLNEGRSIENKYNADMLGIILQNEIGYKRKDWTKEEMKILMDNLDKNDKEISLLLGTRSIRAVSNKKCKIKKQLDSYNK